MWPYATIALTRCGSKSSIRSGHAYSSQRMRKDDLCQAVPNLQSSSFFRMRSTKDAAGLNLNALVSTGIRQANIEEPMLAGTSGVAPHIRVGVSVEEAFDGQTPTQSQLANYSSAFRDEQYWLTWTSGKGKALLMNGFGKVDMLRLLWQVQAETAFLLFSGNLEMLGHVYSISYLFRPENCLIHSVGSMAGSRRHTGCQSF